MTELTDGLENVQKIYKYMETPEYVKLLYAIFQRDVDKCYSDGKRVVIIEFGSTKRLVEWIENGDCSCDVRLYKTPTENGLKCIQNGYPRTTFAVKENPKTIAIAITTSLISTVQCFGVSTFLPEEVDFSGYREKYPKQFEL